jgi:hypothetical protein
MEPEPWQSTIEASLRLIDQLDDEISDRGQLPALLRPRPGGNHRRASGADRLTGEFVADSQS